MDDLDTRLQVSINTIYGWWVSGYDPKAVKIGKHLRWRDADVDAWVTIQFESA